MFLMQGGENSISYIKGLRTIDSRSTKQPLYRDKLDIVFGVKSDHFLSQLLENISGLVTNAITLDRALSYYVQVCWREPGKY